MENLVIKTSHIFKHNQIVIGTIHVVIGLLTLAVNAAFMWMTSCCIWSTLIIPCGTLFGATGMVIIRGRRRMPRKLLSGRIVFSVCCWLTAIYLFIFCVYDLCMVSTQIEFVFHHYRLSNIGPIKAVLSLLLLCSSVEGSLTLFTVLPAVSPSFRSWLSPKSPVYTIPYEDFHEEDLRGPDIVPDIRQRPVLQVDWDINESGSVWIYTGGIPPEYQVMWERSANQNQSVGKSQKSFSDHTPYMVSNGKQHQNIDSATNITAPLPDTVLR